MGAPHVAEPAIHPCLILFLAVFVLTYMCQPQANSVKRSVSERTIPRCEIEDWAKGWIQMSNDGKQWANMGEPCYNKDSNSQINQHSKRPLRSPKAGAEGTRDAVAALWKWEVVPGKSMTASSFHFSGDEKSLRCFRGANQHIHESRACAKNGIRRSPPY